MFVLVVKSCGLFRVIIDGMRGGVGSKDETLSKFSSSSLSTGTFGLSTSIPTVD